MAFLFGRKPRGAADLVRSTRELVQRLVVDEKPQSKVEEEVARNLMQMKTSLQGTPDSEASPTSAQELIEALIKDELLLLLAQNIHLLPFEARKDAQVVFSTIFRYQLPDKPDPVALNYIVYNRPDIILALCMGYEKRESAMPCGGVLREALKHDAVLALILYDEPSERHARRDLSAIDPAKPSSGEGVFWRFFEWIDKGAFELSADAFSTFREILTRHKELICAFLETNFDAFFAQYNRVLVQSDSYVTKRQSIKLLGEILLDRKNYSVMTRYVDAGEHLKLVMNLLRDDRRMVNYEGFHVFKIFVANPHKSVAVQRILINNKDRLLRFLPNFLADRKDDDQFNDEKSFLIRQIELLPAQPVAPPGSGPDAGERSETGGSGGVGVGRG